jgi:hypothetical protein
MTKATKTESTFRLEYAVSIEIAAAPEVIWKRLTDAKAFPSWNSTVTSIEGDIAEGRKLTIRVPISERAFTPKVVAFEPNERMVWADGMAPMFRGARTFTLASKDGLRTTFSMVEVFTGIMLPMIKGSLPDFGPVFEQYAADLARACTASGPV